MKITNQPLAFLSFYIVSLLPCCTQIKQHELSENPGDNIAIVSHRGAPGKGPENTFASATAAISYGADYVEIDVRRSKDGVHYIIHDPTLERTTNGTGPVSQANSGYIDRLDAGSWFGYEFAGEPVPRLYDFLKWIKGKTGIFFNIKDGDLNAIIKMVYELGLEGNCIFLFSDSSLIKEFRTIDQDLDLIIDASSISQIDSLVPIYNPRIVLHEIVGLTDEFINDCHKRGLKVMACISGKDWAGYRKALSMNIDLVNIDSPDVFTNMAENNGIFKNYRLIAHRGGITGGKYNEYDPASIQEAIDLGYYMLEIDVRETKDGVLIAHHDNDFRRYFNDSRRVDEILWEDIQNLVSDRGGYHPLSFEEVAKLCSGKVKLMIDIKVSNRTPEFYNKLGDIMERYDLLDGAYFLGSDIEQFMGRAKMSINMGQIPRLMEMLERGEDVARNYFLFDAGTRMTSSAIKLAQQNYITVVAAINTHNYRLENHWQGAKRDIEFLKECGVTEFQIDSHYDQWLPLR